MSAVRFYVDEHVSRAVVRALRVRGADVQTVAEAGLLGATDTEHLAYAAQEGRVLFTQDDDFLRLAASHAHAGIVYVPQRMSVGAVVRGLVLIYPVLDAEEMRGRIEFL